MAGLTSNSYQPATVEDWDDETQASIPGTRTTANVAVKRDISSDSYFPHSTSVRYQYDGTDSGYVSMAPTTSSMASSNRRRNSDLKIDTMVVGDRERNLCATTAAPGASERQSIAQTPREKQAKDFPKPVKKPFRHDEGLCWVCDKFDFHFDPKNPPKDLDRKGISKPSTPAPQISSQPPKKPATRSKPEEGQVPRPPPRRMSSNPIRPMTMYASTPVQAPYPQYPAVHHGWNPAPPPPTVSYTSYPYIPPGTPVSYVPQQYFYEPAPVFEEYTAPQPKTTRRVSMVSQERPPLEKKPSRTNTMLERTMSREQRPPIVSHRSTKSIDADKAAMPPPPKPQYAAPSNTVRPRPGRSNTYHPNITANRRSRYEESDDDDDEVIDPKALLAYREPPASPRRPPSSYKPPVQETSDRPQLSQKSNSYHNGSSTVNVASTAMPRRRTTESVPNTYGAESKEAEAEAYMKKRGSMPVVDLTAENLRSLKKVASRPVSDQRSESGSTASHVTQQSSSKDSSIGRGRIVSASSALGHSRGPSMSINFNGLSFNITDEGHARGEGPPVKLDVGGIQISMGNRDKENIEHRKPMKQIERAPSMSSRPSRRSLTQSSLISAATNGQRREKDEILGIEAAQSRERSRRGSYVDDDERESLQRASSKSSRQASRNTSTARQPGEELPVRPKPQSHRSSVDYSRKDEPVM